MRTTDASAFTPTHLLRIYYAATLIFVVLDYFFSINVRLAFLDWLSSKHGRRCG
jgi:hypothetical protein